MKVASSTAALSLARQNTKGVDIVTCTEGGYSTAPISAITEGCKDLSEVARIYFKYGTSTGRVRQILQPRPQLITMSSKPSIGSRHGDRLSNLSVELLFLIMTSLDVIPFRTVNDPLKPLADTNCYLRGLVRTYREKEPYLVFGSCEKDSLGPTVLTGTDLICQLRKRPGSTHIVYLGCVCGKGCIVEEGMEKMIIAELQRSPRSLIVR